jgi:hypothetical protein
MALAPCAECGHEISTGAKKCPNCGAKNRAYKSKAVRYWLAAAVLVVVGFITYIYHWYGYEVAHCDTPDKRESFASVIDNSSYSQLNKLRVIDITNIKTIKSGDSITDLVCEATIDFNSRRKEKYRFTWRRSESGALLIQAKEIR